MPAFGRLAIKDPVTGRWLSNLNRGGTRVRYRRIDGRMVWGYGADKPEHKSIGKCKVCGCDSEHFVNWNDEDGTRKHGIICEKCCSEGRVNLQEGYKKQFQNACKVEYKN